MIVKIVVKNKKSTVICKIISRGFVFHNGNSVPFLVVFTNFALIVFINLPTSSDSFN